MLSQFAAEVNLQLRFTCDLDPWLMYSPPRDRNALNRFNKYYNVVLEDHNQQKLGNTVNRDLLARQFVNSVYDDLAHLPKIATAPLRTQTTYAFNGFYKRYGNSHKFIKGASMPMLFNICLEEKFNPLELSHYISMGLNPNLRFNQSTLLD